MIFAGVRRAAVALALVVLAAPAAFAEAPGRHTVDGDLVRLESSVRTKLGTSDDPVRGRMISAILRGPVSADALRAMGVDVGTQAGGVTTVRMPLSAAPAVARLQGVESVRLSLPYKLHHDLSIPDVHGDAKRTQSPPLAGFNGNKRQSQRPGSVRHRDEPVSIGRKVWIPQNAYTRKVR